MNLESAERPGGVWARAERLELALWVLSLFWSALVVAMAVLTPVSSFGLLVFAPLAVAAGFSLCLRLHAAFARHRRGRM